MTRHIYPADTVSIINNSGYNATYNLQGAGTVEGCLSGKQDNRYIRINLPYDSNPSANCAVLFTSSALPSIDPTRKQSRFLRCVVQIRATSSSGVSGGSIRFRPGSDTNFLPDQTFFTNIAPPGNTYPMLYPINGSNGGANYWTGDGATVQARIPQVKSSTNGVTGTIDIEHVRFEYGEADGYIDVDSIGAANRDAGLGGGAWTNPSLSIGDDTDGATYGTPSSISFSLDRTMPTFGLPGKYQGLEIWDAITPNQLNQFTCDFANWPLAVPASNSQVYEMVWRTAINPRPPGSVTPPGGSINNSSIMGYWVWGGGPGDNFADPDFGLLVNGWTGLTEARLKSGGHAPCAIANMKSSVTTATTANRVFYRIFYDRVPGGPLLLCEV